MAEGHAHTRFGGGALGHFSRTGGRTLAVLTCMFGCLMPASVVQAGAAPLPAPLPAAYFDYGGLARTYTLHVPPGLENPAGLVINLHAGGLTSGDQAALTHYNAIADAHGFVVAYPDGIDLSWADGRGASVPDRQGVDDVGFISALVTQLVADFGIDPDRVYATGLSAGAFMANRLACDRADLFAAIAPVAGTLGTNVACAPSEPVAVLETHGTADSIVPYNGGPMVGRGGASTIVPAAVMADVWRNLNGCEPPAPDEVLPNTGDGTQSFRSSSNCADGTSVVFTRVDGGGHTWPGAPTSPFDQQVGRTTYAFDASAESGQFFAAHAR